MATVNGLGNNQVMTVNEKINRGVALNQGEFKSVMQSFKAQIADALPVHLKKKSFLFELFLSIVTALYS